MHFVNHEGVAKVKCERDKEGWHKEQMCNLGTVSTGRYKHHSNGKRMNVPGKAKLIRVGTVERQ